MYVKPASGSVIAWSAAEELLAGTTKRRVRRAVVQMKLIDAEQMKNIVDEYIEETGVDVFTVYHIHDFLDECDAVDAEPVKHGKG